MNILGRGGTTLIAVSLALLLVSLVPQIEMSSSWGNSAITPGKLRFLFSPTNLTPQQEMQIVITANGTLNVALLEITPDFQSINGSFVPTFNLTDLQELREEHPEKIAWESEVEDSRFEQNYIPTRIVNASVVVYNLGSENAYYEYDMAVQSILAPGDKVRTIAYFAAPIGLVMAIPWILDIWKGRKKKTTHIE
jgi:hypothetical protein